MAIKLVAIDIDGTLITDKGEITPKVYEAIQKAKKQGVKIVIATGRPLTGVHDLLDHLELNGKKDFVITYNGGLLQEAQTGKEIARYSLTYDDYLEIEMWSRKLKVHMHAITNDAIYTANRNISHYTVRESTLVNMPIYYRTADEMTENLEIVKTMYIDEPDHLTKVIQRFPAHLKEKYTTVRSAPFYFEILNPKASKGNALLALTKKLNLTKKEVMAIGDAENDLSMLKVAGLGVAMENAVADVKKEADVETASNNHDGVAVALEKWVL
ncbi:MAG: sugar-phosphatase [Streptococcaceae bacterium]|jgi:Cof subfamily protein (haloacid dehalogenase superfamily)|nr:sugar-phosphatase [Streptococcaceae bacterium]